MGSASSKDFLQVAWHGCSVVAVLMNIMSGLGTSPSRHIHDPLFIRGVPNGCDEV